MSAPFSSPVANSCCVALGGQGRARGGAGAAQAAGRPDSTWQLRVWGAKRRVNGLQQPSLWASLLFCCWSSSPIFHFFVSGSPSPSSSAAALPTAAADALSSSPPSSSPSPSSSSSSSPNCQPPVPHFPPSQHSHQQALAPILRLPRGFFQVLGSDLGAGVHGCIGHDGASDVMQQTEKKAGGRELQRWSCRSPQWRRSWRWLSEWGARRGDNAKTAPESSQWGKLENFLCLLLFIQEVSFLGVLWYWNVSSPSTGFHLKKYSAAWIKYMMWQSNSPGAQNYCQSGATVMLITWLEIPRVSDNLKSSHKPRLR